MRNHGFQEFLHGFSRWQIVQIILKSNRYNRSWDFDFFQHQTWDFDKTLLGLEIPMSCHQFGNASHSGRHIFQQLKFAACLAVQIVVRSNITSANSQCLLMKPTMMSTFCWWHLQYSQITPSFCCRNPSLFVVASHILPTLCWLHPQTFQTKVSLALTSPYLPTSPYINPFPRHVGRHPRLLPSSPRPTSPVPRPADRPASVARTLQRCPGFRWFAKLADMGIVGLMAHTLGWLMVYTSCLGWFI